MSYYFVARRAWYLWSRAQSRLTICEQDEMIRVERDVINSKVYHTDSLSWASSPETVVEEKFSKCNIFDAPTHKVEKWRFLIARVDKVCYKFAQATFVVNCKLLCPWEAQSCHMLTYIHRCMMTVEDDENQLYEAQLIRAKMPWLQDKSNNRILRLLLLMSQSNEETSVTIVNSHKIVLSLISVWHHESRYEDREWNRPREEKGSSLLRLHKDLNPRFAIRESAY